MGEVNTTEGFLAASHIWVGGARPSSFGTLLVARDSSSVAEAMSETGFKVNPITIFSYSKYRVKTNYKPKYTL